MGVRIFIGIDGFFFFFFRNLESLNFKVIFFFFFKKQTHKREKGIITQNAFVYEFLFIYCFYYIVL